MFSSQMSTLLLLVLPRVTAEDFDIKIQQCAVIHFFVRKCISLKETAIDKLCNIYIEDE